MLIASRVSRIIPNFLKRVIKRLLKVASDVTLYITCIKYEHRYKRKIKTLREKPIINVAFFALYQSVWKYEYLYKLLANDKRFNPIVLVCPIMNYGCDYMLKEMENSYEFYKKRGYNVVKTYDKRTNEFLDIEPLDLDIVFYTNPYKGLIHDKYYITNLKDCLTSYVSYNFGNGLDYDFFLNLPMHNLVWKLYAETCEHKTYSKKYALNAGKNVVVTGYPGVDFLLDKNREVIDPWKIKKRDIKRIIWAPHHAHESDGVPYYTCFYKYYEFMFDMAKKYSSSIQIAFKPHPLLRVKLEKHWGVERVNMYYDKWNNLENGFFADGAYEDLFITSDAMIHDSGSFLIEYLYVDKPVMRTNNGEDISTWLNPFALKCLKAYNMAYCEDDIESFIKNIINGDDILKDERKKVYNDLLMPPNNLLPSVNMYNDLIRSIYVDGK